MTEEQQTTDLAVIDAELEAEAKQVATALVGMPIIGTKGGRFTFPDDHEVTADLDLVIVAGRRSRQLWAIEYDEAMAKGVRNGVLCAAISNPQLDQSMTPFMDGPGRPSDECDKCAENQWERNAAGKRVKVGNCKDSFLFAVMAPDLNPADIYLLRSSATGVTESVKAIQEMKAKYGHPIKGIATFGFKLTPKGSPRLTVKAGPFNPNYAKHAAYRARANEMVEAVPTWYQEETPTKTPDKPKDSGSERVKRPSRSAA